MVDKQTRSEANFFEAVRTMLVRLTASGETGKKFTLPEVNQRINELLKHSIKSEGVINLFSDVGTEFSLFDPKFLEEISRMKEKNLAVGLLKKLIAEQVSVYRRTNVVKSEKFSEIIQSSMNRYLNGMLTNEQVIEELLKLCKDIAAANAKGEKSFRIMCLRTGSLRTVWNATSLRTLMKPRKSSSMPSRREGSTSPRQ